MGAIEIFGKYYSGVIIEAMEGIACREMWGGGQGKQSWGWISSCKGHEEGPDL